MNDHFNIQEVAIDTYMITSYSPEVNMTRDQAIENLQLVINDCNNGYEDGPHWDRHSWDAMADLLEQVKTYIQAEYYES
jgi:hypothetical protein